MAGIGISSSSRVMTPPPSVESPSVSSSSTVKRAESDGPGQGDSGGTSPTSSTSTTTSTTSQPPPPTDSGTTTTMTTSDHTPTQTTSKTTHTSETTSRTTRTSDTKTTSTRTTTTSIDDSTSTSTTDNRPTSTSPPSSPTNGSNNTPNVTPQNSASAGPSQTMTSTSASQSYTTITTVIDGQSTTFTSPLPTSLSTASPNAQSNRCNAIIAGSTAAGIILLLLLLSGVFVYRRKQLSSKLTLDALLPRRSKRERRGLLDGEFEDDDDEDRRSALAMRAYRDFASTTSLPSAYSVPGLGVDSRSMTPLRLTPISTSSGVPLVAAAPGSRLSIASMPLPQPAPPAPGEPEPLLVTAAERAGQMERIGMPMYNDPFEPKPSTSLDPGLGNIVDDVMGPSPTATAATNALAGSLRSSPGLQVTNRHSSSPSYDSTFSGGVSLDRHSMQALLLNDPFRSALPTKSAVKLDELVYFPQPDMSGDLAYDGIYRQARRLTSPSSSSGSGLGFTPGAAALKKPSSLAKVLSLASCVAGTGMEGCYSSAVQILRVTLT